MKKADAYSRIEKYLKIFPRVKYGVYLSQSSGCLNNCFSFSALIRAIQAKKTTNIIERFIAIINGHKSHFNNRYDFGYNLYNNVSEVVTNRLPALSSICIKNQHML